MFTAPPGQVATQRLRLAAGLVVGLGMVILLAMVSLQAGLAGLFVFGFSALVAYAANAKQVNKLPERVPPRRPSMPSQADPRTEVLLVADGEPATYDGPQYWAQAYREHEARGERIPHWFVRPQAYGRIRAAYRLMGGLHPLDVALSQASGALQTSLGPSYAVRHAYLQSHPYLARALVALAEEGFRSVIIVPLGIAANREPGLRQAVADSRIREIGVQVTYTLSPEDLPGQADLYTNHLSTLDHGHPLRITPDVASDEIQGLARLVQDAEESAAPR